LEFRTPASAAGLRLGAFLYNRLRLSRSLIRRAKSAGAILVDGEPSHLDRLLQGGELIRLAMAEEEGRVAPEPMPLQVIWEDEHLLVVEKPAGVVVHPVKDYQSGTLANGVAFYLQARGEEPVARPVQRLDRETSGLILFAKNQAVAGRLAAALEAAKLERRYLAFVEGAIIGESGTIDLPIRRVWGHPVAREVAVGPRTPEQEAQLAEAAAAGQALRADWTAAGQRAVTHWRVLARYRRATLVECRLETGRTHQIRVHLAHLGHPLLGDELYGHGGRPGRQALHAAALAFCHPFTGEMLRFESPLPPDLQKLATELEGE
jgi:23S rRNA pseudouridine1911/1915/1917 synthase